MSAQSEEPRRESSIQALMRRVIHELKSDAAQFVGHDREAVDEVVIALARLDAAIAVPANDGGKLEAAWYSSVAEEVARTRSDLLTGRPERPVDMDRMSEVIRRIDARTDERCDQILDLAEKPRPIYRIGVAGDGL